MNIKTKNENDKTSQKKKILTLKVLLKHKRSKDASRSQEKLINKHIDVIGSVY